MTNKKIHNKKIINYEKININQNPIRDTNGGISFVISIFFCIFAKTLKLMNTIELNTQKVRLTREILNVENENIINNLWIALKGYNPVIEQSTKNEKREIGFLNGKANVVFADDWEMTPEELGMV